jgi:hypothetical protein
LHGRRANVRTKEEQGQRRIFQRRDPQSRLM